MGRRSAVAVSVLISLFVMASIASDPVSATERAGTSEESRGINAVGFFLGATTKFKEQTADETGFTIAGEYEYTPAKWDHKWGFAGVVELIFMDELEGLVLPLVYYHPVEPWFVRTGVGLEYGREEDAVSDSAHLVWRAGVGYDIRVGKTILVPSFDLDFLRSDVSIAYGVVIAKEF
jgi:hypothetical protein